MYRLKARLPAARVQGEKSREEGLTLLCRMGGFGSPVARVAQRCGTPVGFLFHLSLSSSPFHLSHTSLSLSPFTLAAANHPNNNWTHKEMNKEKIASNFEQIVPKKFQPRGKTHIIGLSFCWACFSRRGERGERRRAEANRRQIRSARHPRLPLWLRLDSVCLGGGSPLALLSVEDDDATTSMAAATGEHQRGRQRQLPHLLSVGGGWRGQAQQRCELVGVEEKRRDEQRRVAAAAGKRARRDAGRTPVWGGGARVSQRECGFIPNGEKQSTVEMSFEEAIQRPKVPELWGGALGSQGLPL